MARPIKEGFPMWNPQRTTIFVISLSDKKLKYKKLRNSSSGFIKRKDVKEYIFKRDNYKCVLCSSKENLQVDHIHSIWEVVHNKYPLNLLNTKDNLQTLCKKCNEGKLP